MSWFEILLAVAVVMHFLLFVAIVAVLARWVRAIERALDEHGVKLIEIERSCGRSAQIIRLDDFRKN